MPSLLRHALFFVAWTIPTLAAADPQADAQVLLAGFSAYHSVCNHCHGPDGLGSSFGPSLVDRAVDQAAFLGAIRDGVRGSAGVMKGYAGDPNVMGKARDILAYISARADGELGRGRPGR